MFRGSLNNVLQRYSEAANYFKCDVICRVCGDSPFVDIKAIDRMYEMMLNNKELEYICPQNQLNGFLSEVFPVTTLKKIMYNQNLTEMDLEHVTHYITNHNNQFYTESVSLDLSTPNLQKYSLTIDYPEDLILANEIATDLKGFNFTSEQVLSVLEGISNDSI